MLERGPGAQPAEVAHQKMLTAAEHRKPELYSLADNDDNEGAPIIDLAEFRANRARKVKIEQKPDNEAAVDEADILEETEDVEVSDLDIEEELEATAEVATESVDRPLSKEEVVNHPFLNKLRKALPKEFQEISEEHLSTADILRKAGFTWDEVRSSTSPDQLLKTLRQKSDERLAALAETKTLPTFSANQTPAERAQIIQKNRREQAPRIRQLSEQGTYLDALNSVIAQLEVQKGRSR